MKKVINIFGVLILTLIIMPSSSGAFSQSKKYERVSVSHRQLTFSGDASFPSVAPDNAKVAFIFKEKYEDYGASKYLAIIELNKDKVKKIGNEPVLPYFKIMWLPNAKNIILGDLFIDINRSNMTHRLKGDFYASDGSCVLPKGNLSPDGNSLLYTLSKRGPSNLYLLDLSSHKTKMVTAINFEVWWANWLSDGKQIICYGGYEYANNYYDKVHKRYVALPDGRIWLLQADSGMMKPISPPFRYENISWSPHGRQIAFTKIYNSDYYELWVMNVDGSNAQKITSKSNNYFSWSPNGRWLVYSAHEKNGDLTIWIVDPYTHYFNKIDTGLEPAWASDGKKVVYVKNGKLWLATLQFR